MHFWRQVLRGLPVVATRCREDTMNLRISRLLAIATFAVSCLIGNAQTLAQNAYITGGNGMSVIDTATDTVTTTIPVGFFGVAVTPDGSKVYVPNSGFTTVSVIDAATSAVTATIGVGIGPFGAAVTPDGSRV